jgi:hypothetical protein
LKSLNGEPWLPGRPFAAECRAAAQGKIIGCAKTVHGPHELPHLKCTCGVYAAKNREHLRQFGYAGRGIHGEVYLWGHLVEHRLGWRAEFAYPKCLLLRPEEIPFTLAEIDARLKMLIAFGTDIFILGEHESIRFWKNVSGFDAEGLDYLIKARKEHYVRRLEERTLQKGDRVAVLGRGIAVVNQVDNRKVLAVLGSGLVLRIVRRHIVMNQQNRRWECGISS